MGMFTQPDGVAAEEAYGRRQANLSNNGSPQVDGARTASTLPPTSYTYDTPKRRVKKHTKKKKSIKKKSNLKALRLEHGMCLLKMFGKYYVDNVESRRSSNAKPSSPYNTKFYKEFVAQQKTIGTKANLKLRQYRPQPSPSTLQKWWDEKCVSFSDFFFFELPLEDFRLDVCYDQLKACKKHHKAIKRKFVTCPTSRNGYGRRVFLMDMNKVIMNHIYSLIEELTQLIEDHGVEKIRVTVYLWRGNDKSITSVHNKNICDVLTFVKDHLAKASNMPTQVDENEHAEQIREALEQKKLSDDIQLLHSQNNITLDDLNRIEALESRILEIKNRHKKQEQAKQRAAIASAAADAATDVYYNTQMQLYKDDLDQSNTRNQQSTPQKSPPQESEHSTPELSERAESEHASPSEYEQDNISADEEMLSPSERVKIRKEQIARNRAAQQSPEGSSTPEPIQDVPQPTPPSEQQPVTPIKENEVEEEVVATPPQEVVSPIKPIVSTPEAVDHQPEESKVEDTQEESTQEEEENSKEENTVEDTVEEENTKEEDTQEEEPTPVKDTTPVKSATETPPPPMPNPETPSPQVSESPQLSARERIAQRRKEKQAEKTNSPSATQSSTSSVNDSIDDVDESNLSSLERIRLRRKRRQQQNEGNSETSTDSSESSDRLAKIKARLAARRA
eukprot:CAMPEP_0117427518 /NCGR_PEP_ID=MMETSP0758-20121206/7343_1 /TAXON_ID=63605 /ORGANISM="Percolomonas cosmopolitus, Strain AE-1 (ATCC 50343)" /LENGTH=675 /DNA_ID=CAMNT_0005213189 /DNA_START=344 /DNA_END=2367 /DNA_ORIENTATION=-